MFVTFKFPLIYSLIILSNLVTSHIHLSILVSATLISISFFYLMSTLIYIHIHKNSLLLENVLHNIFLGSLSYAFSKSVTNHYQICFDLLCFSITLSHTFLTYDSLILHISYIPVHRFYFYKLTLNNFFLF